MGNISRTLPMMHMGKVASGEMDFWGTGIAAADLDSRK
ncbi:hypothetical protein CFter6_4736 [Collimonas fungivorans]|uniref:Uncharacterized protein n=1 Tax=Collimonas fungivorans TaxID=158899 RepID=A0A127PHM5_9BURK|nr:hypothetical protein CFter6_4736 [Collimonas fungivorans]